MAGDFVKPRTAQSGIGQKATDKGQFANPPAYVDVSGVTGPSKIAAGERTAGIVQKSPGAKGGRV